MTLKQLCKYFKDNQYNESMCEHYKNEYMLLNKDRYNYENLDESDIAGLRPYLMCWVLALYEYLANYNNEAVEDWFNKYSNVTCKEEDNDYYKELVETGKIFGRHTDELNSIFNSMLEKAIPEFKKRGITLDRMYDVA